MPAMTPPRAHAAPRGSTRCTADPLDERGLHVYRPPPERRGPRMNVAVERRTVSLWPTNASPLSRAPGAPRTPTVVQPTAGTDDPATGALAAITSSYRQGRAGIISGDSSPSAGQLAEASPAAPAPPVHFPTVPLGFLSTPEPAEVPRRPLGRSGCRGHVVLVTTGAGATARASGATRGEGLSSRSPRGAANTSCAPAVRGRHPRGRSAQIRCGRVARGATPA